LLGKLRRQALKLFETIASPLTVLPADTYTVLGLVLAALAPPATSYGPLTVAIVIIFSGLLDGLDGTVARLRGEASPRGAFLDSMLGRVADALYATSFLLLGYNPAAVLAFISGALITSYARARYESLTGKSMEGIGLLERSDRIAAQVIVLLVHAAFGLYIAEKLYMLLAAIAWVTVLQRLIQGLRSLPGGKAKVSLPPKT
jgi:archaetidylinositol phosphate synthase